ncbi:MAG: GtrA family protein, partial [Vitreimonas sp.]
FFLNNWLTYRDMRLRGFWNILRGLLTFYVVCAAGLISNVGIASYMFNEASTWWIAAISGILVGAVWNYAVSTVFTWRART